MLETSYLNPEKIKKQSTSAIFHLSMDNESMKEVESFLNEFCTDKSLEGVSFDSLRRHISDYTLVLRLLRSANDSDIADHKKLCDTVGDEILDGATIYEGKRKAYEEQCYYCDLMDEYLEKASDINLGILIGMPGYYTGKALRYASLSQKAGEVYQEYIKKEEKYDEIEQETKNLFSTSIDMRSTAKSALESLGKAFANGGYSSDIFASWRVEMINSIYTSIYSRVLLVDDNGNARVNFDEVEKILNKNIDNITSEEWDSLLIAYINANEEDLSSFIKLFMGDRKNVEYNYLQEALNGSDYSEWKVDKTITEKIIERGVYYSEIMLIYKQIVGQYDSEAGIEVKKDRSDMLQKLSLLSAIQEIETFRGTFKADSPDIEVSFNYKKEGSEDYDIVLNFKEYSYISSYAYDPISGMSYTTMTNFNLSDASIEVKNTLAGSTMDNIGVENARYNFSCYFGKNTLLEDTNKFIAEETAGAIIDKGADKVEGLLSRKISKITASNIAGAIPYVGDLISFGIDIGMAEAEKTENQSYIDAQFDILSNGLLYADFDCVLSEVEYNTFNDKENSYIAFPGERTDGIIKELNEKFGANFSREMLFKETGKANEIYLDLCENYSDEVDEIVGNK